MFKNWHGEWLRLAAVLFVGISLAKVSGQYLLFISLAFVVYLLWHFKQLGKLSSYLKSNLKQESPHLVGAADDLLSYFIRYKKSQTSKTEQLQEAIYNFQKSAQNLPDATLILDIDNRIVWLNRAACKTFGLRWPQDIGLQFLNLARSTELAKFVNKGHADSSINIVSPLREDRFLNVRKSEYGENGHLITARDITALIRADEMRKDFVSNASHELKTPLTVLIGYLELLENDSAINADLKPLLEAAAAQATRMHKLVEDLLNLSRVESQPGKNERVDVANLLESIIEDACLLHAYAGHNLVLHADRELSINGDFNHLLSAFSNLIYNAVIHTPANTLIQIDWYRKDNNAVLSVVDYGNGIDGEHLSRLTERFYRVQKGRERSESAASEGTGTGLGLAIVKHVVSAHQGSMEISSNPGTGTAFNLYFPALH